MTDRLWQKTIIERDKWCALCRRMSEVAHHLISKGASEKLRHNLDNGVGLCAKCHNLVHTSANHSRLIKEIKKDIIIKLNKIRYGE